MFLLLNINSYDCRWTGREKDGNKKKKENPVTVKVEVKVFKYQSAMNTSLVLNE